MNKIRLSSEQQLASEHLKGPGLTLAVPGSGKTTLLMMRTMSLMDHHKIPAQNILTMTFSKASAEDMKRRFRHLFPAYKGNIPSFMTIHSFCYSILKQYQKKHGLTLKLIDNSGLSKFFILKEIIADISGELISDEALEQVINEIGYVKNMMLERKDFKDHTTHKAFQAIYDRYEAYKKQHQVMDFDDMLTMTFNILSSSHKALEFLRVKYPFIQVDEAQDTSNIQFELLKLLGGSHPNIFMVADDDQSIYAFRGANPKNLLAFEHHFGSSQTYYLSNNYRSTKAICTASNAFIDQNKERYVKSMVPQSNLEIHTPVYLREFEELNNRNDFIIEHIEAHQEKQDQIGILFRNNSSAIGLAYLLYKKNIEFYIKDKAINFFNHFAVKDIIHFLELSLADNDVKAFERIAQRTGAYIPPDAVEYVKAYNRGRNVFETLLEYKSHSKSNRQLVITYREILANMYKQPPLTAIRQIERDLGYMQRIEKIASRYDASSDSIKRVLTQLKIIARSCGSITGFFLEEIMAFKDTLLSGTTHYNSQVQFSTFHSSKGLEYHTVFIIDPLEKETAQQTVLMEEEERRLFYVAMTRAKEALHILYHRFEEGAYLKEVTYFQFLKGLDKSVLTYEKHRPSTSALPQDTLIIGNPIQHVKFGQGYICELDDDTITIEFSDKIRRLSYSLCKEKGLL